MQQKVFKQNLTFTSTLITAETKGNFLNLAERYLRNTTASIALPGQAGTASLWGQPPGKDVLSHRGYSGGGRYGGPSQRSKARERIKGVRIGRKKQNQLFINDMVVNTETARIYRKIIRNKG